MYINMFAHMVMVSFGIHTYIIIVEGHSCSWCCVQCATSNDDIECGTFVMESGWWGLIHQDSKQRVWGQCMKVEGGRHFKAWVHITICQFFVQWRKGLRTFGCCCDF